MGGNWLTDQRGTTAIAFAAVLPVLVACLGISIDYGRAVRLQDDLKAAADASALAATVAAGDGMPIADAITVGKTKWAANAAKIFASVPPPNISIDDSNGMVTTTVNYKGDLGTTFAKILGTDKLNVSGLSVAQASINTTTTHYSGNGDVWGDPHLDGADGYHIGFMCPRPYWYDMLSDSGIQVNVACTHLTSGPYPNTDIITDMEMVLGTHTISMHNVPPDPNLGARDNRIWHGEVTIDGTVYNPTSTTALATWPEGAVWDNIVDGGHPAGYANDHLTVETPQYVIQFYFNPSGDVTFSAASAGSCGVPGGLWGETLGGINDTTKSTTNSNDVDASAFEVASGSSTSTPFSHAPCATTVATKVRLIK